MTEQTRNTKDDILQAALELFAEKGYHNTSMSAIADQAGVGKGTLYWHFSSKEELFQMLIMERGKSLFQKLHTSFSQDLSPEVILKDLIHVIVTFIVEHRLLALVMLNDILKTGDEFKKMICQKHIYLIHAVQQLIERGMEDGVFRQGSARGMTIAILGMINSVNAYFLFGEVEDITSLTESYYQMILHGIKKVD